MAEVVAAAAERQVPIRIGVNAGSLEKELLAKYEQEKKVDPDFAVPPSDDFLRRYALLHAAHAAATEHVRPGVSCESVDAAARAVIEAGGEGARFFHRRHQFTRLIGGCTQQRPRGDNVTVNAPRVAVGADTDTAAFDEKRYRMLQARKIAPDVRARSTHRHQQVLQVVTGGVVPEMAVTGLPGRGTIR